MQRPWCQSDLVKKKSPCILDIVIVSLLILKFLGGLRIASHWKVLGMSHAYIDFCTIFEFFCICCTSLKDHVRALSEIKASKELELREFQAREKQRASDLTKRLRLQKEAETTKVGDHGTGGGHT